MELIALLVGGVLVGGAGAVIRARKRAAERTRQLALLGDHASESRVAYTDAEARFAPTVEEARLARARVAAEDPLHQALIDAERSALEALREASQEVAGAEDPRPEALPLTDADLRVARRAWREVLHVATAAGTAVDAFQQAVTAVEAAHTQVDEQVTALEGPRRHADAAVEQAADRGYHTEAFRRRMVDAQADADSALEHRTRGRPTQALVLLARAATTLTDVAQQADHVAEIDHQLGEEIRHAEAEHRATAADVEELAATVTGLRERYAETVWDGVASIPGTASEALETVGPSLTVARDAHGRQDFAQSREALGQATTVLEQVEVLCTGVQRLVVDVTQAEADVTGAVAEAREALGRATAFVERHRADVSPVHAATLRGSEATLTEATLLAGASRPDPLRALEKVLTVTDVCDAILAAATSDKAGLDAERSAAARAIASASSALRAARGDAGYGLFGWSAAQHASIARMESQLSEASRLTRESPHRAAALARSVESASLRIQTEAARRKASAAAWDG